MKLSNTDFQSYHKQDFAKITTLFVLKHFKPNLKKKPTPKKYMKKTVIDLSPDAQPDLIKLIHSDVEFVVKQIDFRSEWFTVDGYIRLWKKQFEKFLDKHNEIQQSIHIFENNFPNEINEQFTLIINSLSELNQMLQSSYDIWQKNSTLEYINSDLTIELYKFYSISYICKISIINSFIDDLKKLKSKLHLVRSNNRKISHELTKFEKDHIELSRMLSNISRSELTLRLYLNLNNSRNLADMFVIKPLKLRENQVCRFNNYLNEFKQHLEHLPKYLDTKYLLQANALNSTESKSFNNFRNQLFQTMLKT